MTLKDRMETIKNVGDDMKRFDSVGVETEREPDIESATRHWKNKRIIDVAIEIRANCGKMQMTRLEDTFNLQLEYGRESDNEKVLYDKLENIQNQLKRLLEVWSGELGR